MVSRVTRAMGSFLTIFSLLCPSVLDLGVKHGTDRQTDRQTTAINALCPALWRRA